MLEAILRLMGLVARGAAQKPIHFLIFILLLALVAYLQVVDEYIPSKYLTLGAASHFYHPPGTNEWQVIDDPQKYPEAEAYVVSPLKFVKCPVPEIPHLKLVLDQELVVVVGADHYNESDYGQFIVDGVVETARHHNRLSKYWEYGRHAYSKIRTLIAGADGFDVALVVVAYLAMWYTIIKLFYDMKQVGLNFWVAFATLCLGMVAFLFALFTLTKILNAKVPSVLIAEGIPFLVATVGFKHKSLIARAIMNLAKSNANVTDVISQVFGLHSVSLLRDTFVVIGTLLAVAGYASHLEGLRNFSILSALILFFDLVLIYTFLASILALKIEIRRARRTQDLKEALEEEGLDLVIARQVATNDVPATEKNLTLFDPKEDSTVVSFKVAMIALFIAIHAFYLGSLWLYQSRDTKPAVFLATTISDAATSLIKVGRHGAVALVMPTQVYTTGGTAVVIEDFVLSVISAISNGIQDSFISKLLLFGFVLSICINAYLLNALRYSAKTTLLLMKRSLSTQVPKPKPSKKLDYVTPVPSLGKTLDEMVVVLKEGNVKSLGDDEVALLVTHGKLPLYALEKQLADNTRAVVVRRKAMAQIAQAPILDTDSLPYANYDYDRVFGACCENVIGYMPLPVGIAGPLIIDDTSYYIPMAKP